MQRGEVWAHPSEQFDAPFPHFIEWHECVRSWNDDALEEWFVMNGTIPKPLEHECPSVNFGARGPSLLACWGIRSSREAEAQSRTPEPRLVVDRSPKSAVAAATEEVDPQTEHRVSNDSTRTDGASCELLPVLANDFGQHFVRDVVKQQRRRCPPVLASKSGRHQIVNGVTECDFEVCGHWEHRR